MGGGKNSGHKDYVAGLLAGVATVAVGHPFDTVKVKLQNHSTEANGVKYQSGFHCAARVLKTEGVKGLYRGATSSFLGMAFESSLIFGIYSQTKKFLEGGVSSSKPQPGAIIPAAAFGGTIISFILCPTELVKLTGIFRGGYTTLLRESIGNAVFFSTYEFLRYNIRSKLKDVSYSSNQLIDAGIGITTGGLSGIATNIQTSQEKNSTKNPFRILTSIYRRSGLRGCYAGVGPTLVRAFPANAAAIVTWELAVKMLGVKRD